MENTEEDNQTVITQFILLGFRNLPHLHIFLFLLFLVIYILTMAGNLLIVVLVVADPHLHTPMYFFLGNLSCLEVCYSSTILPRMLAGLLTGDRTISVRGCIVQLYFFGSLVPTECSLLAAMSYDRYLAICKPLHYATLMNDRLLLQLAAGSWLSGFLNCTLIICFVSRFTFCGPNEIDHFFCDFLPVLKLSCNDITLITWLSLLTTAVTALFPFLFTLMSYVYIIGTILRIPSTIGRQKAFSTCASHLLVVIIFYGTILIVYMFPDTSRLRNLSKTFSVFYTVLTPLINPLIYSLRNKEVKGALRKSLSKQTVRF
ncbi:olfactory receptor 6N1-like [Pelodiscus sinensis]|uniref:olfactory receptor 6N1-like n=1 Tax=Pelodiscus sinensis TaxID=13735 RepID=UPI003F6A793B